MTRKCDVCGFEQDTRSESGQCQGCGFQLDPHPDHEKPAPGIHISRDHDEPFVVDDTDVEIYPELEGVISIHELEFEYGRGIGAEHYGYATTSEVKFIHIPTYRNAHADRRNRVAEWFASENIDACTHCGAEIAKLSYSANPAADVGAVALTCSACERTFDQWNWY